MTEPRIARGFLIARADGTLRVVRKNPSLDLDEVAFPITVTIPTTWGRVQSTKIEVTMPEPPEARVTVGEPELGPDEGAET